MHFVTSDNNFICIPFTGMQCDQSTTHLTFLSLICAVAGGSAMAVAAADVVIMSDNLLRLPSTISICKHAGNVRLRVRDMDSNEITCCAVHCTLYTVHITNIYRVPNHPAL